jgi:hypothetical protein
MMKKHKANLFAVIICGDLIDSFSLKAGLSALFWTYHLWLEKQLGARSLCVREGQLRKLLQDT